MGISAAQEPALKDYYWTAHATMTSGTDYVNNTGYPIFIVHRETSTAASAMTLSTDYSARVLDACNVAATGHYQCVQAWIPPGGVYTMNRTNGTSGATSVYKKFGT